MSHVTPPHESRDIVLLWSGISTNNFLPLIAVVGGENCRTTKADVVGDDNGRVSSGNYDSYQHLVWSSESKAIIVPQL